MSNDIDVNGITDIESPERVKQFEEMLAGMKAREVLDDVASTAGPSDNDMVQVPRMNRALRRRLKSKLRKMQK